MKVIFLGTNGWYDTKTGNTTCILIETKKEYIILDAGNGLYKIDKYIISKKPIYLFLSHFHLDHIVGFHILNKFSFTQGIDVYGPPGTEKIFTTIINNPYTMPIRQLKTEIRLNELDKKSNVPVNVEFRQLKHSSRCYGFRFTLEGKTISYCPDTGVCENAIKLAKDADLLVTECSFKSGQYDKEWPHLNPEEAAQIAKQASVKKLALIHFDANIYQTLSERKEAQEKARRIFKNTFAAIDDMEIEVMPKV